MENILILLWLAAPLVFVYRLVYFWLVRRRARAQLQIIEQNVERLEQTLRDRPSAPEPVSEWRPAGDEMYGFFLARPAPEEP